MRKAALALALLLPVMACSTGPADTISGLTSDTGHVRGRVAWADCGGPCPPVDGTPVNFADASRNRTYVAVSDSSGAYAIQLPPGTYTVIAGRADRSPYQRRITVERGAVITLNLTIALPTG